MQNSRYISLALALTMCCVSILQPALAKQYTVKVPVSYYSGRKLVTNYDDIPVVSAKGEMQVKVGDVANDFPQLPSQALSGALKLDSASERFRVSWTSFSFDYTLRVTALYNRTTQRIKVYRCSSGGQGETYSAYHSAALLDKVTDKMLHQLAANTTQGAYTIVTGGFEDVLPQYGARVLWSNSRKVKE